jgi:hypothetical protein
VAYKTSLRAFYMQRGRHPPLSFQTSSSGLSFSGTSFWTHPPCEHYATAVTRWTLRTGSGSNRGQLLIRTSSLVVHKPAPYQSTLPRYQSPVLRNARPPLRGPTALVPYLGSSVTYYAARVISRDGFESLCNKSDKSFRVNFHSKGRAIFS